MTKMETLLTNIINDKIIYKKLWEITIWDKKFNGVDKSKQLKVNNFKHLLANKAKDLIDIKGDIKILSTGEKDSWTTEEKATKYINNAEIISIPTGGRANLKYWKGKFIDSNNLLATTFNSNILNLKFLYYYLLTNIHLIESCFQGGGIKHPKMVEILEIVVPIPSLEIQNQIVSILDKFTELEAELEAELSTTKNIYKYYRDKLLDVNENTQKTKSGEKIKWLSMNDICKNIFAGEDAPKIFSKIKTADFDIPIYSNGLNNRMLYGWTNSAKVTEESVSLSARGTIGYPVHHVEKYFPVSRRVCCIPNKNIILPKFLKYFLDIASLGNYVGAINGLTIPQVKKILVPIIPIQNQQKIINILDNLSNLTESFSDGIPAEIKLIQQQYKFYRNKLLTFKEVSNG